MAGHSECAILQRLERLARDNRRLRRLGQVGLILDVAMVVGGAGWQARVTEEVAARR
jgi:hypothetical protein